MAYCLVWNIELVSEYFTWYNGTLGHEGSTIVSVRAMESNTVPMLDDKIHNSE